MDEHTIKKLSELYVDRRRLRDIITSTKRPTNGPGDSFWERFFEKCGAETGSYSSVVGAVGTHALFSKEMGAAWVDIVERRINLLEAKIRELGGEVK